MSSSSRSCYDVSSTYDVKLYANVSGNGFDAIIWFIDAAEAGDGENKDV